ncbi:MAG: peptidase M48 [Paracoccus denitrificans]|nr:MAG: peptidase M48 [Paracoccus denitrificans]PZO83453.1 MAG: peptidase M48 [Paracoccus denitrificans]
MQRVVLQQGIFRRAARIVAGLGLVALVAACADPANPTGKTGQAADPVAVITTPKRAENVPNTAQGAARNFITVITAMEPAVERECLQRRQGPINCDFQFVVDDRPGQEPNAFQTLDNNGRPIIGFTLSLLAAARNADELAFVVGHEASHHILNHISQKTSAAQAGAAILTGLAAASGGDPASIRAAQRFGAQFGAQYYSKDWELQADYLGAIITANAGYDPINGARFFERVPDPGNKILGSHPSRKQRQDTVARAIGDLRSGRIQ